MRKLTIAIDGHSSCGKSTMAKTIARKMGYVYVDTGAMYRCVTLYALRNGLFRCDGSPDEEAVTRAMTDIHISFSLNGKTHDPDCCLNGENVEGLIRGADVAKHVSGIAALPAVRKALVRQQQDMGRCGGVVMDGRDIGTTVFPHADLKIFVTADARVRAQRRRDELKAKGLPADFDSILRNIERRDYTDAHRDISPLVKADDAILLDNSRMTIDEQDRWLLEQVERRLNDERQ